MSRTVLTVTQATTLDTGYSIGPGFTPDATNGNIVPGPVGPFHLGILVINTAGSSASMYLRASGYAGSATGGANASYATGQYQPFAQASVGDNTITLGHANGGYTIVEELSTDRYCQADGSLWIDWSTSTDLTVFLWQKHYMP